MLTYKRGRIVVLWLVLTVLALVPVQAQDSSSAVISPENVAELRQLGKIESDYLGQKAWSPDSQFLAIGTNQDGIKVFSAHDLNTAPLELAGGLDITFHPSESILASGGFVWNIASRENLFNYGQSDYRAFSPDGQYLLAADLGKEEANFRLWQADSGEILYDLPISLKQRFVKVFFSADSQRYALYFYMRSSEEKSLLQVYETNTGNFLASFELAYPELEDVVFINANQELVVDNFEESYGGSFAKILIWDIATKNLLGEFESHDNDPLLSPDGTNFFITDYYERNFISLNSKSSFALASDNLALDFGSGMKFSPDGRYLATRFREDTSETGIVFWYSTPTEAPSEPVSRFSYTLAEIEQYGRLTDYTFSPDSRSIALAFAEEIVIWDIESQIIQKRIPDTGQVRFSADGAYLFVDSASALHVWEWTSGQLLQELAPTNRALISSDGRLSASLGVDRLTLTNLITGERQESLLLDDYYGEVALMDAASGRVVFQDKPLYLYDLVAETQLLQIENAPCCFNLSPDASLLTIWSNEQTPTLYPLNGQGIQALSLDTSLNAANTTVLAASPDGAYLLIAERELYSETATFYLYQTANQKRLVSWQSPFSHGGIGIFSPDSQYILISAINTIEAGEFRGYDLVLIDVWSVEGLLTGDFSARLNHLQVPSYYTPFILDMGFSPNEDVLFITVDNALLGDGIAHDYQVSLLDWQAVLSGATLAHTLKNAYQPVFSPDSTYIFAFNDNTLWEYTIESILSLRIPVSAEPQINLEGFKEAAFSPDGQLIAALSQSGEMLLWETSALLAGNLDPLITWDSPRVQHIAFSPDGRFIYQQTSYSVIRLGIEG